MRIFFTVVLCVLFLSVSGASLAVSGDASYSRPEIRSVWMDRRSIPNTEQGIRDLIRSYDEAGINLVYPEVIFNGYSACSSSFLLQKDLWSGLDMLGILVNEAHKRNIEVHPWVWIFRVGNASDKGGILSQHPDWAALDRDGKSLSANNSYWLCPSIPEAWRLLISAIKELAQKYPIDGVNLDYIRFENQEITAYCYNQSCRDKFKAEYGIDPLEIQPFTKPVVDWHLWRENLVNTFVSEAKTELSRIRQDLLVSAAVGSYPDNARLELLQNWPHWADNKWVDYLLPMNYTTNMADFDRRMDASINAVGSKVLLAPGLGLNVLKGMEPVLEQIRLVREKPLDGVALFSTAYLDASELQALKTGPFSGKARLPVRKPIESAELLLASAREHLQKNASSEDLQKASAEIVSAKRLVEFQSYRIKATPCIPPSPPPIFIPDRIQPLPGVEVLEASGIPKIDGKLDDDIWKSAVKVQIKTTNLGFNVSQPTDIFLAYDQKNLYVAFRAYESNPERIKAAVNQPDGPVFNDDSFEVFLSIEEKGSNYYHFAINSLGAKFEQRFNDPSWNGVWLGSASLESGAWAGEIAIPLSSIGLDQLPQSNIRWRANFCRNRIVNNTKELSCWSETYGSYHTPERLGFLHF